MGAKYAFPGRRWASATVLIASLALGACGDKTPAAEPPPTVVPVTTVVVKAADTPVVAEYVGKTASSRRVEIRSRVDGFLEKREYTEGEMVTEGQVLFQMDRKPFQAQVDLAQAELAQQEARLETAKANLDRIEPLAQKRAVAQKELDDAKGLYRTAAAAVEGAKAKLVDAELKLGYTTIKSPVAGQSSYATKREGAYVGMVEPQALTYIAQLDPMWVEFSVSENQILKVNAQHELGILQLPESGDYAVEVVFADGSVWPHTGRITFADASLSERTGTFLLRAEIANPEGALRPGQFVIVRLKGATRPKAVVVPQRAVQQGAQGSFVWAIGEDGKALLRPVKLGPFHNDDWFVDAGLKDGETIVVDGAQKLRQGAPVAATPLAEAEAAKAAKQATDR